MPFVFAIFFSCSHAELGSIPLRLPTQNAEQVFAVDLNGDLTDELVTLNQGTLTWADQHEGIEGTVVASAVQRLKSGGPETLYIVTGRSRTSPNTRPKVYKLDNSGLQSIFETESKLHRISDIDVGSEGVFITVMDPDKTARGGFLSNGTFAPATQALMGLKQLRVDQADTVIGRLYGDEPRSDGGLFIVDSTGTSKQLSSKRGVRTLVGHDIDFDGHTDLLVGDGWHYQYGTRAEPTLRLLLGPDFSDERLITELPDGFTISQIVPVNGSPSTNPTRLVVLGSSSVYLLEQADLGWKRTLLGRATQTTHIAVANHDDGAQVVVSGTPIQLIPLDSQ